MENTFENFIKKLKEMFDAKEDFYETVKDSCDNNYVEYSDLAKDMEYEACKYLIKSNGGVNYTNKSILEENGFKVYPGEQDSFGWLTGVIERNNRQLVFG